MNEWILLLLLPFHVIGIDFRSNNYRQILNPNEQVLNNYNNVNPQILKYNNNNNPYSDIFVPISGNSPSSYSDSGNFGNSEPATTWQNLIFTDFSTTTAETTTQWTQPTTTTTTTTTTTPSPPPISYHSYPSISSSTTTRKVPETVWTTTKPTPTLKLSKNPKITTKIAGLTSFDSAQLSVLSHRLLNDILIIPSSRRLYILVIVPIHQSAGQQNFECGEIDVNAVIRMAAFLESLKTINESRMLKEIGADIGAIIIDSCSTDLRSVADLYELLSGTNIQRNDLIAIIRDDGSYMPNTEQIMKQLSLPVINTFFTANTLTHTTGILPTMILPIQSIIATIRHYQSTCVNLIFDEKFEESAQQFQEIASSEGVCVEAFLLLKNVSSTLAESAVRRLLLSDARIVVSFLTEDNWIHLTKALRSEMVIAGRFVFISIQDQRWSTSRKFVESWPTFEQSLISITPKTPVNAPDEIRKLTDAIPKLSLPNLWLKQFWASAFKCHVETEETSFHKFSKECATTQSFNISTIAPDVDISSISIAAHAVGIAFRRFVDKTCPGALVISLSDCVNDPFAGFHQSIIDLDFVHHLSDIPVSFNYSTGYRDVTLQISRVQFEDDRLQFSEIGTWDGLMGYRDRVDLESNKVNSSRGSYLLMSSSCPRSSCAKEVAKNTVKQQLPSIFKALTDVEILIFTIFSVLSCLTCLMCMYLKVISTCDYRNCTAICFLGLAFLSLSAPAFIMSPNAISCSLRKLLFPIAFCITIAPVFVKTVFLWRYKSTEVRGNVSILASCSIIAIQTVISSEWLILSPDSGTEFVSTIHGTMWRCSPGDASESLTLISCSLSAFMTILSFVFSLASLKHSQSLQHLMISILAILFEIALYVSLPLLPYKTRDIVMATAILIFSFTTLLVSHLNRSTDDNRSDCATLQKNEGWLQQVQGGIPQSYHTASTHAQSTMQIEKQNTLRRENPNSHYGVEAYELSSAAYSS